MRKVNKNFKKPPGELGPIPKHNDRLIRIYNGNGTPKTGKIYQRIYGASAVRKKLRALYFDKCAYCETKDPEFEIEHYRPKRGVEGVNHNGYYWLCYEWSNLVPACHHCNKKRSKSTKFPIEGMRIKSPVIRNGEYKFGDHHLMGRRLKRELPLLVHPEEPGFDPNKFFKFDKTGYMLPAATKTSRRYRRAKSTIDDIVRLNREQLYIHQRKKALREYEQKLLGYYLLYLKLKRDGHHEAAETQLKSNIEGILKEIKQKTNPNHEYSFFWTYVFENFYAYLPQKLKRRPVDRTRFKHLITNF